MNKLARMSVRRSLLLAGAGLVLAALVLGARETGTKTRQRSIEQQTRPSDEVDEKTRGVILRLRRKQRLTWMCLAGRLTLLETAAHFSALNDASPEFNWTKFREGTVGDSDEERLCREVIERVRSALASQGPTADRKKVERLEAELREHLRHGPPRLPHVEPPDEV
jgi:hypothetical protein